MQSTVLNFILEFKMTFSKRNLLVTGLTLAGLFGAGAAMAQERVAMTMDMKGCHCSHPVNHQIVRTKADNPTPFAGDFSATTNGFPVIQYDDKGVNRHVRDTISWKLHTKTCETKGFYSWTVINNGQNGLQSNDTTAAAVNGVSVPGTGGYIGSLKHLETKTFGPYALTPAMLKNGRVSVNVQDDTALLNFKVDVTGCCITPN